MENNVDSKYKLIALILVLIILIIGVNILKNIRTKDEIWNYDEITSATDVISSGSIVSERAIYYKLEDIVVRFLLANDNIATNNLTTENIGYDASYKEYYSILTADYKRHLSRAEFNRKSEEFLNKFISEIDMEKYKVIETRNIIKAIYRYDNEKYLCVLMANNNTSYLGVKLNSDNNTYNIFYIE